MNSKICEWKCAQHRYITVAQHSYRAQMHYSCTAELHSTDALQLHSTVALPLQLLEKIKLPQKFWNCNFLNSLMLDRLCPLRFSFLRCYSGLTHDSLERMPDFSNIYIFLWNKYLPEKLALLKNVSHHETGNNSPFYFIVMSKSISIYWLVYWHHNVLIPM